MGDVRSYIYYLLFALRKIYYIIISFQLEFTWVPVFISEAIKIFIRNANKFNLEIFMNFMSNIHNLLFHYEPFLCLFKITILYILINYLGSLCYLDLLSVII